MIVDRQGRRFRNLRVSLTAACNYAAKRYGSMDNVFGAY